MNRLRNAWHNIVIHPIAGVLWLFGCQRCGDWVHGAGPAFVRVKLNAAQREKIQDLLHTHHHGVRGAEPRMYVGGYLPPHH